MTFYSGQLSTRGRNLGEALSDRRNTLNFVRLVLASMVILGHAWPLTGSKLSPNLEFLSGIAVEGFFIISGYLIAASRLNSNFVSFVWKRILRIMPAFWTVLVLTAVVFGPLAALIEGKAYNWLSGAGFVFKNFFLMMYQWGIDGTLTEVPYPNVWNGSLWTLSYEFLAYLAVGVLLSFKLVRSKMEYVVPALFIISVLAWALFRGPLDVSTNFYLNGARLGSYFLAGAAYFALRKYIRVSPLLLIVSIGIYALLFMFELNNFVGQLFLGYFLLAAGSYRWTSIATKNDISYGVYIYAFPVQQFFVLFGSASLGIALNVMLTLTVTICLAWLSWTLVEKPALRWKNLPDRFIQKQSNASTM